ncbi:hypothetical protein CKO11_01475 [Rhodobacter sp. TJ_12]|uniref:hypothetical protein n=1 Tax=Rhodobacter sp. TJ_12 TaxID=2029399 RepID=UPI001CBE8F11|nr:hypothetical protein [Rhodobacter sp. TJ_12]MBZ4021133.1 hypothetical protein [Rhodobacter sp. TJ_12]
MASEFRRKESRAQTGKYYGKGAFIFSVSVAILVGAFIIIFESNLSPAYSIDNLKNFIAPAVTALVASASLVVSFVALKEQTKMRQAGTDPVLIAHLGEDPDQPSLVRLRITNVGAGAAMNVSMRSDMDLSSSPKRLTGKTFDTPFVRGEAVIRTILQGNFVSYNLGLGFELLQDPALPPFKVSLRYQDIEGVQYSSSHLIDVTELAGQPANEPPLMKISRSLEKISNKLK